MPGTEQKKARERASATTDHVREEEDGSESEEEEDTLVDDLDQSPGIAGRRLEKGRACVGCKSQKRVSRLFVTEIPLSELWLQTKGWYAYCLCDGFSWCSVATVNTHVALTVRARSVNASMRSTTPRGRRG